MATATKSRITVDEFLAMDLGEGQHELVRGEIVAMTPPPSPEHGYYCGNIYAGLREFGRRTGHGYAVTNDSAVRIGADTVRGPDVAYYNAQRLPREQLGTRRADVLPELVVEVLSPGNRPADVMLKVADYLRAGIASVWIADPGQRTVTIFRGDTVTPRVLGPDNTVDAIPELPGFACPVAEFFA